MSRRGAFIVVEGLDRSGKTTQTSLLYERVSAATNGRVKLMKFPGESHKYQQILCSLLIKHRSSYEDRANDRLLSQISV
jgi:dTMP kinase